MRETKLRRFGLLDVMIGVAAAAGGMVVARPHVAKLVYYLAHGGQDATVPQADRLWLTTWLVVSAVAPFVLALSIAWLALRLRRPRPGWMRLALEPGFLASTLVILVLGSGIAFYLYDLWTRGMQTWLFVSIATLTVLNGAAISGLWLGLWSSGEWKAACEWVDRLGRCLGASWVMLALALFGLLTRRPPLDWALFLVTFGGSV